MAGHSDHPGCHCLQSQAAALRLRRWSVVVVVALIIVDIAMFITFWQLLTVQRDQVKDLRSTSRAVNRVMYVALYMR
jgi:hypothetical protein